jgi:MFS family permease
LRQDIGAGTGVINRSPASARRSRLFLLILALANAGGVIAWLPVLTLLLPMQVELVAGPGRLGVLTATVLIGALVASAANIVFGVLSDRALARGTGRRPFAAGGLLAVALGCAGIAVAGSAAALVIGVAVFQVGVNALLAPLLAIVADEVPDAQKGLAGGLLAFGYPVASALTAVLLSGGLIAPLRFVLVPVACAVCVVPLLATVAHPAAGAAPSGRASQRRRDLALAWSARLLVQIAGNVMSLFLLYYFESVSPAAVPETLARRVGHLLLLVTLLPMPVVVLAGRLSDRTGARKPLLLAATVVAVLGLIGMAGASGWTAGAVAFGVYSTGSSVFLALHVGFSMQLLPSARHRGRDLGLLNLANTLPALVGPLLAWGLATRTSSLR